MGFSRPPILEIEARFARRVGQRLDAAVVEIARAVKDHRLDAGLARALSDEAPDFLRRVDVGAGLQLAAHVLLERGGGRKRDAALVVDDLRVDLLRRAEHRQPRPAVRGLADRAPNPRLAAVLGPYSLSHDRRPLLLLAFLAEDELVRILHALALVGLRAAEVADLGGGLADLLLVDAGDDDLRRLRGRDRDAGRDRIIDVVAVAERQLQGLAGDLGAVADAIDLELLLETLGDAVDEALHLGAGHAPLGAGALRLVARRDADSAVLHGDGHLLGDEEAQLALGALHLHGLAGDARRHPGRHRNRLLAYSRHVGLLTFLYACGAGSEDLAEHFAADVALARLVVGHDTLGRRQNGGAEPIGHARHGVDGGVDAPARLRHPLDGADHRLAVVVLELDRELGAAVAELGGGIVADVAFRLQDLEHVGAQARARRLHRALAAELGIADAGQHIAERICHRHGRLPTSST